MQFTGSRTVGAQPVDRHVGERRFDDLLNLRHRQTLCVDADASRNEPFPQETFEELGSNPDLREVLPWSLGLLMNVGPELQLAICLTLDVERGFVLSQLREKLQRFRDEQTARVRGETVP